MRTVLLTGPTRGIGAATCNYLLKEGHRVIGISRTATSIQHPNYIGLDIDLQEHTTLDRALGTIDLGSLDTVIANAGAPAFGTLEQFSSEQIAQSLALNLVSPLVLLRHLIPVLRTNAPGDVVLIGSEAALRGARKGSVYCAAKFGLRGFAQALRAECASAGVRVCIINPGMVRTPFFDDLTFEPGPDPSHAIEPDDVARAISMILNMRPGTAVDEINLSPKKHVIQFAPSKSLSGKWPIDDGG